ncbi:MAG: hypothetical protein GXX79_11125 [Actinomycetales bacterium]|nr:hypothetical protein [Actinomycetales bacterium]
MKWLRRTLLAAATSVALVAGMAGMPAQAATYDGANPQGHKCGNGGGTPVTIYTEPLYGMKSGGGQIWLGTVKLNANKAANCRTVWAQVQLNSGAPIITDGWTGWVHRAGGGSFGEATEDMSHRSGNYYWSDMLNDKDEIANAFLFVRYMYNGRVYEARVATEWW